MLPAYRKKANVAAGVYLISMAMALIGPISNNMGWLAMPVSIIIGISFFYALWAYVKAKGYRGILGLILPLLPAIGLVILMLLPDKCKELQSTQDSNQSKNSV